MLIVSTMFLRLISTVPLAMTLVMVKEPLVGVLSFGWLLISGVLDQLCPKWFLQHDEKPCLDGLPYCKVSVWCLGWCYYAQPIQLHIMLTACQWTNQNQRRSLSVTYLPQLDGLLQWLNCSLDSWWLLLLGGLHSFEIVLEMLVEQICFHYHKQLWPALGSSTAIHCQRGARCGNWFCCGWQQIWANLLPCQLWWVLEFSEWCLFLGQRWSCTGHPMDWLDWHVKVG